MKILVAGAYGMLGTTLSITLKESFHVIEMGQDTLDITNQENIKNILDQYSPDIVVNCAAYTAVDKAESEIELSNLINGYAPGYLAKECRNRNIQFIHVSTDYVFSDNNEQGHTEEDNPGTDQLNQYGKSKRLGEVEVMNHNPKSYIVRTSWVFGPNGKNFIDSMINLSKTKTELSIVSDEMGVPSFTKDISKQIKYIIENFDKLASGYYHAINEGKCTRFEEAEFIFKKKAIPMKLNQIQLKDYPRPAKIANYSILINTKLPKLQSWEDAISEYLQNSL